MHSKMGAWEEAQLVYVKSSRLDERLGARDATGPHRLWDLGLGIGANALAALETFYERGERPRDLHVLSFERDPAALASALEHALANPGTLDFLIRRQAWVRALLAGGLELAREDGARAQWELRKGDFLDVTPESESVPDTVFWDFYSPKTSPELWTAQAFGRVPRGESLTTLHTYSAATHVRFALREAGWHVGRGPYTSFKSETTLATSRLEALADPLDSDWFHRKAASTQK